MTPSDVELARYAEASYSVAPTWARGDVHVVGTPLADGTMVICPRGSTTDPRDWVRNLSAWLDWSPEIHAFCHSGFYRGALGVYLQIKHDTVGRRLAFGGHSLGAALALMLAALFIADGVTVDIVATFGAPRPGSWKLRRVIRNVRRLRQYRNGNDPVTDLPWLPGIYVHPSMQLPIGHDEDDPFVAHQIQLYREALETEAPR